MQRTALAEEHLAVGILAGGRSRRLGVDKAFIRWRGISLLQHALRGVSRLSSDIFILAKDVQPYREFGCHVLPDVNRVPTPLSGIVTIAPFVSGWLLLTACDILVLRHELFRELWMHRAPGRAVVLRSPKGLQPFAALYPAELLHLWVQAFENGQYRLQRTLESMPKTILSATALEKKYGQSPLLVNVNTRDDLRLLEVLADDPGAEWRARRHGMTVEKKIVPAPR